MRAAGTEHHGPPLRLAFGLDGLAIAALLAYVVVTGGRGRQDDGFFTDPLPDGLAVLAFAAAIAAGAVAAWALVREPPRTRAGRWALGLAIAFVLSFPVLGLLTEVLGLEHGWAEPVVRPALPLATALGAMVLGAFAREPGRRGLLFIPLLIGASALIFFLGDLLVPQ
jgi:hypothetical protein